jgi:hydrogenase maturation protease
VTRWLVLGYGNTLRGDDGVGPAVARAVADWRLPGVRALAVHQLTPELAAEVADAAQALFVDAAVGGGVELQPLEPSAPRTGLGHVSDPQGLLALAQALHGRSPRAWLLTVPAPCVEFGETLSDEARRGVRTALERLRGLPGLTGCAEVTRSPAVP